MRRPGILADKVKWNARQPDCVLLRRQPAVRKDVDYLLIAKPVVQLTTWGSAVTVRPFRMVAGRW